MKTEYKSGYRPGRRVSFPIISVFQTCTSTSNPIVSAKLHYSSICVKLRQMILCKMGTDMGGVPSSPLYKTLLVTAYSSESIFSR